MISECSASRKKSSLPAAKRWVWKLWNSAALFPHTCRISNYFRRFVWIIFENTFLIGRNEFRLCDGSLLLLSNTYLPSKVLIAAWTLVIGFLSYYFVLSSDQKWKTTSNAVQIEAVGHDQNINSSFWKSYISFMLLLRIWWDIKYTITLLIVYFSLITCLPNEAFMLLGENRF